MSTLYSTVRNKPSTLIAYMRMFTNGDQSINTSKMLCDCLASIGMFGTLASSRMYMWVISVYNMLTQQSFGQLVSNIPDNVIGFVSPMVVTVSLQPKSVFNDNISKEHYKITKLTRLDVRAYYWVVEFRDDAGQVITERYITFSFSVTKYAQWHLEYSCTPNAMRYIFCALNLVLYSVLSKRVPTFLPLSTVFYPKTLSTDTRYGVDGLDVWYIYFVLKPKSLQQAVTTEGYHSWVYCQGVLEVPYLLFDFMVTKKVLSHLVMFYDLSPAAIKYLTGNNKVVDLFKISFTTLARQLSNKSRVDASHGEDTQYIHNKLVVNMPEYDPDPTNEGTFELEDMLETTFIADHIHRTLVRQDVVSDIYTAMLVPCLFYSFDRSFALWLSGTYNTGILANTRNSPEHKLSYFYRQVIYYMSFDKSNIDFLLGTAASLNAVTLSGILSKRSNLGVSINNSSLISWKSLLVVS